MPLWITALLGGLIEIAPTLIGRIFIALGVSAITYTGIDTSLTFLKTEAVGYLNAFPANLLPLLVTLKVGVCINMVFSAMLARAVLNGLGPGGAITKWVKR
jgi:Protein of unknown function (DUF2523)